MSQFSDIEVFEGKKLSDVFKDIYDNHEDKKKKISDLISELQPLVDGLGDATLLVPLIKDYLDISVKNDDQLVKLAQIVQRIDSTSKSSMDSFDFESLQGLVEEDSKIGQNVNTIQAETAEALVEKKDN